MIQALKITLQEDLNSLKNEVKSYSSENNIWRVSEGISNSAGNLCLHIIGNLKTYIGAALGKTSYIRKRDLEFSLKDISRLDILEQIDETITIIEKTFDSMADEQMTANYPAEFTKEQTSMTYMLIHLVGHLNYHLGQINYHRRLLDK